jgi:hypothetical protein
MSWRTLVLILALCAAGWWFSPHSPRVPAAPAWATHEIPHCPLPPRAQDRDAPLQSAVPPTLPPFRLRDATLRPLAGLSIDARVLSREDYATGRESRLSPTDLALGWGAMRDDAVLAQLDVRQSARWFTYRWRGAPSLPADDVVRSAANMHMIPANRLVATTLRGVRAGDRVRIDGWLVEADAGDGWRWRSSLTREDTGSGACEVVFVCAIARE